MADFPFNDRRFFEELWKAMTPSRLSPFAPTRASGVFPAVNIYDDGEAFSVCAEIPGVDKKSLDLSVKGNELMLRGERSVEAADQASYHRREREGGKFSRVVTLPDQVDPEKISAKYTRGVLEVVLPRAAAARERRIQVK